MNRSTSILSTLVLVALTASVSVAAAQPQGGARNGLSFEQLDRNSDGSVSKAEIAAQAKTRFDAADTDGDGLLTAAEMLARAEQSQQERAQRGVDRMLERMDANSDGALSLAEVSERGRGAKFFERFDTDGDGAVSKSEFDTARAAMGDRKGPRAE